MGWKEAKERYEFGHSVAGQSAEDVVARRVLRGLGLRGRHLAELEHRIWGNDEGRFDQTLWQRVHGILRVYRTRCARMDHQIGGKIEVYEDKNHRQTLERFWPHCEGTGPMPVLFIRRKGGGTALAYTAYRPDDWAKIPELTPPYTALEKIGGVVLVVQDLEHFVRQFGPYDYSFE